MEQEDLLEWLNELRIEHRDLDETIDYMVATGHRDHMKIQRFKRRRLKLKDMISQLESQLIPDLDA